MKILSNQLVAGLVPTGSFTRCMLATLVAAGALGGLSGVAEAKWDRTRIECSFDGPSDYSMNARYESRVKVARKQSVARTKFSVEFEAATGIGFAVNDTLIVSVDPSSGAPVDVGTIKLVVGFNGDLVGEIEYSTQAPSQQNGNKRPFPANFPKLTTGDTVEISKNGTSLGACKLN